MSYRGSFSTKLSKELTLSAGHSFKEWMSFNSIISHGFLSNLETLFLPYIYEPFEIEKDTWYGFVSIAGHRGWLLYGWTKGPLLRNGRAY